MKANESSDGTASGATTGAESQSRSESRIRTTPLRHVLVVDDDRVDRRIIKRHLAASLEPFSISEAESAERALQVLDERTVDCIVLDFHLPEVDGLELIDEVQRKFGNDTPAIVMVTGDDSQRVGVDSILRGAADVVSKGSLKDVDLSRLISDAIDTRQRSKVALTRRLDAFTRLVQDTAHRVNNPAAVARLTLSAIDEALDQQESHNPPPPLDISRLRTLIRATDEALSRIAHVIVDLQNETGTSLGHVHRFGLSRVLDASMRSIPSESVIREAKSSAEVVGDLAQLSRMFTDLLNNAVEASGPGQRVHIRTWDEERFVNLAIDDEGSGVPPEELNRIFDPLYTTHATRGALGMGLARASAITSRHGGTISVEQTPTGGARFHVRLPRAPGEARRERDSIPATVRGGRPRVLVIDDEPMLRSHYERVLTTQFRVTSAESAERAREILASASFDVIMCDVSMPNENGVSFARWLLRVHPVQAHRLIFITGGIVDPNIASFIQRWENGCLHKPIGASQLLQALSSFHAKVVEP